MMFKLEQVFRILRHGLDETKKIFMMMIAFINLKSGVVPLP